MNILSIPSGFVLFGHTITFYGIISALSYLLGIILCCVFAKKRGFKTEDIITLACYVVPFAIIGARVYYVLFKLEYYTNFWDVFKIWEGGLAFYGGMIGGAIAVLLYCLIHKKNFLALLDIIAPAMILAQAVGRWGNFFNQEAYGYIVTDPKWQWFPFAVYIEDLAEWHLATFFYESIWNLINFAIMMVLLYKFNFKQNGVIASAYLILYGITRSVVEGLRTDSLYWGPIRISQILSILFIALGLAMIIYFIIKKSKENSLFSKVEEESFSKIMKVLKEDL